MFASDTIAALSSGWAAAPRALVRVSGERVPELGRTLFDPALPAAVSAGIHRGRLLLPGKVGSAAARVSLPVLAIRFPRGRSFTGEEMLELLVPGNPALVERIINGLCAHPGVREAAPGEFSARAYLGGRMTLDQAEGVAAVIAARSDDQLAAAAALLQGRTGSTIRSWAEELATLLALTEAGIDFTDQEDVVPIAPTDLRRRIESVAGAMRSFLGSEAGAESHSSLPLVVLAGRPNAGKSTLFNALLGRRRSVVSPVAGTTRDVLRERLDLSAWVAGGPSVELADVAGLDDSLPAAGTDAAAQNAAARAAEGAAIVIHCDPKGRFVDPVPAHAAGTVIRVHTKADLLVGALGHGDRGTGETPVPPALAGSLRESMAGLQNLAVCALDGWNMGPLRRAIADAAFASLHASGAAAVLPRHRATLSRCLPLLAEAGGGADPASRSLASPEVVAGLLREALDQVGELVGHISPDEVIGRIFATFCIGK